MRYILTGDPKEVDKVIQENRIRIARGVIKFTPLERPEEVDEKQPECHDYKEPLAVDDKKPKTKHSKKSE